MELHLLHYRPWRGQFRVPFHTVWPIARVALLTLFRRRIFWWFYALGMFIFLMFFFGTFLLQWAETEIPKVGVEFKVGDAKTGPEQMVRRVREGLRMLNGSRDTYDTFFRLQGTMLMVVLALAGSVLVGNDISHGSLPFYLGKPLSRWHYVGGKCLAAAIVVHLLATLPALFIFMQHSMSDWDYLTNPDYFWEGNTGAGSAGLPLLLGVIAYGVMLSVCLSIVLVAAATWVRRTVPMIMVWTTGFWFTGRLAFILVDRLQYDERWRLIDLWNNLRLMGYFCLGVPHEEIRAGAQPEYYEAALVMGAVCLLCLIYLNLRTRAVEVIR